MKHAVKAYPRWTGHGGEFWQNMVHWRREWQTASVFLPWESQELYENCALDISNFLKRSLVFPILLFSSISCIDLSGRLSYLSLIFGTLHSDGYIFSLLLCLSLLLFFQLFVRPPQTTILHFFFLGMILITAFCTMSLISVHSPLGTLSIRYNPLNLLSFPLYNHKGFDLGHI